MTTVADVVLCVAWLVVLGHNIGLAVAGVRRGPDAGRWTAGLVLAIALVAAGVWLEVRSGGRIAVPSVLLVLGSLAAVAGSLVHVRARSALGHAWSTRAGRPDVLVEDGAYAVVRHPLYAGLGLLALGTAAGHPSVATLAGGTGLLLGLVLKVRDEERALAAAFGPRWAAYCARVPCVVPRRVRGEPSSGASGT